MIRPGEPCYQELAELEHLHAQGKADGLAAAKQAAMDMATLAFRRHQDETAKELRRLAAHLGAMAEEAKP